MFHLWLDSDGPLTLTEDTVRTVIKLCDESATERFALRLDRVTPHNKKKYKTPGFMFGYGGRWRTVPKTQVPEMKAAAKRALAGAEETFQIGLRGISSRGYLDGVICPQ